MFGDSVKDSWVVLATCARGFAQDANQHLGLAKSVSRTLLDFMPARPGMGALPACNDHVSSKQTTRGNHTPEASLQLELLFHDEVREIMRQRRIEATVICEPP